MIGSSQRSTLAALTLCVALAGCVSACDACSRLAGPTCEGPASAFADNLVEVGRVPISSFLEPLEVRAVARDRVFFCSGVQGLRMVDATDPSAPTASPVINSSLSDGLYPRCQHIATSGEMVYFTNRGDEVQPRPFLSAVDTSVSPPVEVALHVSNGASFEGVAAARSLVFVAQHSAGVAVLEHAGASFLERATITDLVNAWHVAVQDGVLFIADGAGGLVIASVADPANPTILGRAPTGSAAQYIDLDPDRGLAYVAAGADGVLIFDVSDPAAPTRVGRIDTPGSAVQVSHTGNLVAVADWNDLRVYDTADPTAPQHFTSERPQTVSPFTRVLGVGAVDDLLFVSEWTGFHVYELHRDVRAPDLFLEETEVSFGRVAAGDVGARAIIFANHGNAPLSVAAVTATPAVFQVSGFEPVTLGPGERHVVEVEARPLSATELRGAVELCSDDPDRPKRPQNVIVNRIGSGISDPAPPTTVELTTGETWRLSEQAGHVVVLAYFATF